jgi:hypothetical protein
MLFPPAPRSRPPRRALGKAVTVAAVVALVAGCGGGSDDSGRASSAAATTTTTPRVTATAAERRWKLRVERFAAGLLPALRSVQTLTGGGPKAGAFGPRLDRRVFLPGPTRRTFVSAMDTLSRCGPALRASVPAAPTRRLRPVGTALTHACRTLEAVPPLIRAEVLTARSAADVDPRAYGAAAAQTRDGVRLLIDGLATQHRVLESPP